MAATQDRETTLSNLVSMFAMRLLATEEGYEPDDLAASLDAFERRGNEVARFTEICLPLVKEIDQQDLAPVVAERLFLEAAAAAWQQLQREIRINDLIATAVWQQLALQEGIDMDDSSACADLLIRRSDDLAHFMANCLPQLAELGQPGGDPAVAERLLLEAAATAWQQLQQEVG